MTRSLKRHPADPGRAVLESVVVPDDAPRQRLDRAAMRLSAFPTRQSSRKAAGRGELAVDGEVSESGRWVEPGSTVQWLEPQTARHRPLRVEVPIAHEDDAMAVVVKPGGLVTMGAHPRTLERALPFVLRPSDAADRLARPRPVHRLDARTSGLVVVAKTRTALARLGQAFEAREVDKRYRALVLGALVGEGVVDAPIDGRAAETRYRALEVGPSVKVGHVTRVDAWPRTGRTHQIRRHLARLGHPVLGDADYAGDWPVLRGQGLFLFAVEVQLEHPVDGAPRRFVIDEPPKVAALLAREARRVARIQAEAGARR